MSAHLGTFLDTDEVIRRYSEGESSKKIAADLGCTHRTVLVRLRKAGVEPRGKGKVKPRGEANSRWMGGRVASTQRWFGRNPERKRLFVVANGAVAYAIKTKRLVRPGACEECGKACKPDAAHKDYSRLLDVRWLCRSCHVRWDQSEPKSVGLKS